MCLAHGETLVRCLRTTSCDHHYPDYLAPTISHFKVTQFMSREPAEIGQWHPTQATLQEWCNAVVRNILWSRLAEFKSCLSD